MIVGHLHVDGDVTVSLDSHDRKRVVRLLLSDEGLTVQTGPIASVEKLIQDLSEAQVWASRRSEPV